jgi:Protein of unknown function (DUF3551)
VLYANRGARKKTDLEVDIMRLRIRFGIALTAALAVLSATGARADDWCGTTTGDNAVIQCGYTTVAQCESAVGKGGMCFVDPDTALNVKRAMPVNATKMLGILGRDSGRESRQESWRG